MIEVVKGTFEVVTVAIFLYRGRVEGNLSTRSQCMNTLVCLETDPLRFSYFHFSILISVISDPIAKTFEKESSVVTF
jgi:hypothetical protein